MIEVINIPLNVHGMTYHGRCFSLILEKCPIKAGFTVDIYHNVTKPSKPLSLCIMSSF